MPLPAITRSFLTALNLFNLVSNLYMEAQKKVYGENLPKGEVQFNNKKIGAIVGISVLSGCIASIIGVGGGVIYLPMLLIIGYPPFVASSTSVFMVMYSAAANFISYAIAGEANLQYSLWLGLWTCAGVVAGVTGVLLHFGNANICGEYCTLNFINR